MKTAEEYLEEKGMFNTDVFSPTKNRYYDWTELMESYANEVSKTLLEEAAEKIRQNRKALLDNKEWTEHEEGLNYGFELAAKTVLSLIPKEKWKH